MGETRDLIGIYGAVDREAARNPEARKAVAQLLPAYEGEDPDVHWFDDFVDWTKDRRRIQTREEPYPELEEALKGLGQREEEPRPRLKARRLFAIDQVMAIYDPAHTTPSATTAAQKRSTMPLQGQIA